jgi:hypothetical protein
MMRRRVGARSVRYGVAQAHEPVVEDRAGQLEVDRLGQVAGQSSFSSCADHGGAHGQAELVDQPGRKQLAQQPGAALDSWHGCGVQRGSDRKVDANPGSADTPRKPVWLRIALEAEAEAVTDTVAHAHNPVQVPGHEEIHRRHRRVHSPGRSRSDGWLRRCLPAPPCCELTAPWSPADTCGTTVGSRRWSEM